MTDLYKRLSEIQNNLKVPKEQKNTFGNYHFRSCEDILNALKDELKTEAGECVLLDSEIIQMSDRIYIKAIATFTNGSEKINVEAFAREPKDKKGMDDAQITGATLSYARKYALAGLFAIDNEKDNDTHETQNSESQDYCLADYIIRDPNIKVNQNISPKITIPLDLAIKDYILNNKFKMQSGKYGKYLLLENQAKIGFIKNKQNKYGLNVGTKDQPQWINFETIPNTNEELIESLSKGNDMYEI